ncbi:MAG: hypothetical protein KDC41_24210, partial [Saprospiraceae bacterium]|nr:hypothetical protein [Saprospiraceae bacterium]
KGVEVLLKDIKQEVISAAYKDIWKSLQRKVRYRSLTKPQAEEQIGNLRGQLDYRNFDKADLVIEAVLERMDLKKTIIGEIETH